MNITPQQYQSMTEKASPSSKSFINVPAAFCTGGLICLAGQVIQNMISAGGADSQTASSWTTVILIFISALLTGTGVYEKIARHAGAGTLVPVTGFANAVVSSALDSKTEGLVTGTGAKIFTIAGPVILYGTAAAFFYGIIYYMIS